MGKVYAYIRVSTDEQVNGTSLAEQTRRVHGMATAEGLKVNKVLSDEGVSGTKPFFERTAAHGVEFSQGDTILIMSLDRFSRDPRDAGNTVDTLAKRGVRLIVNGHGDLTSPTNAYAKFFNEMMQLFAGLERDIIKERLQTGRNAKRSSQGFVGGKPPFGYKVSGSGKGAKLVPIPEQQDAVQEMVKMRDSGSSLRMIALQMQQRGVDIGYAGVRGVLARAGK